MSFQNWYTRSTTITSHICGMGSMSLSMSFNPHLSVTLTLSWSKQLTSASVWPSVCSFHLSISSSIVPQRVPSIITARPPAVSCWAQTNIVTSQWLLSVWHCCDPVCPYSNDWIYPGLVQVHSHPLWSGPGQGGPLWLPGTPLEQRQHHKRSLLWTNSRLCTQTQTPIFKCGREMPTSELMETSFLYKC